MEKMIASSRSHSVKITGGYNAFQKCLLSERHGGSGIRLRRLRMSDIKLHSGHDVLYPGVALANSCHRMILNIPLFAQAAWNSQRKDNRDNKWKEFSIQVRMSNTCRLINVCLFSTERLLLQYSSITPHICRSRFLGWFILENKSPPILLLSYFLMAINTSLYLHIATLPLKSDGTLVSIMTLWIITMHSTELLISELILFYNWWF